MQLAPSIIVCSMTGNNAVSGGFIADSDDEVQPSAVTGRAGQRRAPVATQRSSLPLGGTSQLTGKSWGAPQ